jgi:hypothetical protein
LLDRIDINEGKTGANGVPAAFAGLIGVVMITVNIWVSVIFFVICGIMASVTEGIEFNTTKQKYRKYYDLFSLRTGKWKSIPSATEVDLKLNIKSFFVTRWLPSGPRDSGPARERIITFNIILESENGPVIFYEFYKYEHARKALETISEALKISMQDHVEEQMNERN